MANSHTSQITRKYKRLSKYYDPLFSTLESIVFFGHNKNPRIALSRKVGDRSLCVLDVCTGTGRSALAVAESGCDIAGIDLSPEMLQVARKKVQNQHLSNYSLHEMDATKLDFSDGHFDIVMSSFALHEMDYQRIMQVLMEMNRVLKKNGKLFLVDFEKDKNPLIQFIFNIYTRVCYPPSVQEFFDSNWSKMLSQAGFQLDDMERYRVSKMICATKKS